MPSVRDAALEMAGSISAALLPISFTFSPGTGGAGELQWEMVGIIGGKGPTARLGWGLRRKAATSVTIHRLEAQC